MIISHELVQTKVSTYSNKPALWCLLGTISDRLGRSNKTRFKMKFEVFDEPETASAYISPTILTLAPLKG